MPAPQNRSHAVMAQRHEAANSLDDFPTPPWATRALIEHVLGRGGVEGLTCLEPACGRGHMATALRDYFAEVSASDIGDYGHGDRQDFLDATKLDPVDWMITNPPFRLAEDFFHRGYSLARVGVALLVRTVFLEGIGRLERIFSKFPPTLVAQYSERVPMVKGRVDPKASTATGYAWVIWRKPLSEPTRLVWIPPCRKLLERRSDYEPEFLIPSARLASGVQLAPAIPDLFAIS
jgi:hypothetical protein